MSRTRSKPSPSRRSGKLPGFSALYEADLFKGIDPTELAQLLNHAELLTCPAGTMLFTPEDVSERLYILRQGRVDLSRLTADGKRIVIRRILPGSVFGIMGFLGQTTQGNFAEATEDSDVCVVRATVRRRMRRLIQNGTMRIAAIADPAKIGLPLAVMIALHVEHDKLDSVVEQLYKRPEVGWLSSTTGRFDIMALARFPSTEGLSKFIQKEITEIEGIRDSETFVCLNIKKDLPEPVRG